LTFDLYTCLRQDPEGTKDDALILVFGEELNKDTKKGEEGFPVEVEGPLHPWVSFVHGKKQGWTQNIRVEEISPYKRIIIKSLQN
jgi:hypothetical protein